MSGAYDGDPQLLRLFMDCMYAGITVNVSSHSFSMINGLVNEITSGSFDDATYTVESNIQVNRLIIMLNKNPKLVDRMREQLKDRREFDRNEYLEMVDDLWQQAIDLIRKHEPDLENEDCVTYFYDRDRLRKLME